MTTEERLEILERELARAKCRTRWLLAVVGLAVMGLILAWAWNKTLATAQAQPVRLTVPRKPAPVIPREQRETLEEHEAAQDAIELATMKRQCDETFNAAYRAASKAPDEKSVLAIFEEAKQKASLIKSPTRRIRAQNAYFVYLQSTLASQEDRFARLAQAVGGTEKTIRANTFTEKTIRANTFIVEDETGKPCAVLTATKDGPRLRLFDEKGNPRAALVVDKDGPGLLFSDENDNLRVMVGVDKDMSGLEVYDKNGKVRAGLAVTAGGATLGLCDENGKPRAGLAVTAEGAGLSLVDENGKPRAALVVDEDGPVLHLDDESGKTIWHAP